MLFGFFGCNKYEPVDSNVSRYFVKNKNGELFFRSSHPSSWSVNYVPIPVTHPRSFKPLSEVYARDRDFAYFRWHSLPVNDVSSFQVDKEYPNLFATDGYHVFYEKHLLKNFIADDFKTHSRNYISNSEKVLLVNKNQFEGQEFSLYDVPVADIKSFTTVQAFSGREDFNIGGFAKDNYWFYINNVVLPIASKNAVVLSGHFPVTILSDNTFYLLLASYRDPDFLFRDLPPHLQYKDYGTVGRFEYHEYQLYHIEGFEQAEVLSEKWLKDEHGVYFLEQEKIILASDDSQKDYQTHPEYNNVLIYNDGILAHYFINHGEPRFHHFSKDANFLTGNVIKDQGMVYHRGIEVPHVDYESLVLVDERDLMDRNYYYHSSFNSPGQVLPNGAYEKLKNGEAIWQDFFGVKMNAESTVYQDYWGGFAITHQLPKKWREEAFVLQLVQQVGHTTRLEQALEKQLKFYFKVQSSDNAKQEYIAFEPELTLIDNYDYNNIQPKQHIKIEYRFTEDQIQQAASSLPEGAVSTYIGILITRGGTERATPDELYLEGSLLVTDINNENY